MDLVHDDTFIFDGTNYDVWRIRMLNYFRDFSPILERIVDMGFSPPKDPQKLSLEDEKNSYLNAHATNVILYVLSNVVIDSIMPFGNAHDLWTKLQDKYGVSKSSEVQHSKARRLRCSQPRRLRSPLELRS